MLAPEQLFDSQICHSHFNLENDIPVSIDLYNYDSVLNNPEEDFSPIPALSISATNKTDRESLHQLFQELLESLLQVTKVEFILYTDSSLDSLTLKANDNVPETTIKQLTSTKVQNSLKSFLRSFLFQTWKSISPELKSIKGSFEVFNPGLGTNLGWHQDGFQQLQYCSHYYIDNPTSKHPNTTTNWFEVALPPFPSRPNSATTDDLLTDLLDDHLTEKNSIEKKNFLPISISDQKLVIFEDCRIFHRTPLTALKCRSYKTSRSILRIDFYGVGEEGDVLYFKRPKEIGCEWKELGDVAVPDMLKKICSDHSIKNGISFLDALGEYIDANQRVLKTIGEDPIFL